jgi:hypothetical protein
LQYLQYIWRYRKTSLNEVTDVNFQDKNSAKGLHVFDNGSILPSIEGALCLRYSFGDHYNFNKLMLAKSLGRLHPKIDSSKDQNDHGVYRCKMSQGCFLLSKM